MANVVEIKIYKGKTASHVARVNKVGVDFFVEVCSKLTAVPKAFS